MKSVFFLLLMLFVSCQKTALTNSDLQLNGKEAISSSLLAKDQWKSSLFWYCYSSQLLKINTFHSENKKQYFPQIEIKYHHFEILITLYSDVDDDLTAIPDLWKKIVASDQQVCLYLAHLPDSKAIKSGKVFFYIERMKTSSMSWILKEKLTQ